MSFTYRYPHPAVTTDCVILTFHEERLKILLVRRGVEPFKGTWALPGGFLRMEESAEEGALRELREETGVTGCAIKQFHTFSAPGRDPRERVITIAFYALMKWQKATGADDAEYADWIPVDSLPSLAFDHDEIIKTAMEAIRRDIFFEPVGFELLNDTFSMPELQKVYEAILGREFDRRNFAKKIKHLNILEEAEAELETAPGEEENRYPLPFLNNPPKFSKSLIKDDRIPNKPTSLNSLFLNKSECVEEECTSRPSPRKKGLLWRLNRKKYDDMKEEGTFEF